MLTLVNSKHVWRKRPLKLISFVFKCFFFCLVCNMVPENWHICVNKGIPYLLTYIERWKPSNRSSIYWVAAVPGKCSIAPSIFWVILVEKTEDIMIIFTSYGLGWYTTQFVPQQVVSARKRPFIGWVGLTSKYFTVRVRCWQPWTVLWRVAHDVAFKSCTQTTPECVYGWATDWRLLLLNRFDHYSSVYAIEWVP